MFELFCLTTKIPELCWNVHLLLCFPTLCEFFALLPQENWTNPLIVRLPLTLPVYLTYHRQIYAFSPNPTMSTLCSEFFNGSPVSTLLSSYYLFWYSWLSKCDANFFFHFYLLLVPLQINRSLFLLFPSPPARSPSGFLLLYHHGIIELNELSEQERFILRTQQITELMPCVEELELLVLF